MKCFYVLFLFFSYVLAQGVFFSAPPPHSMFSPGQKFVIGVAQHNSLSSFQEVSVAIGLINCVGRAPAGTCEGVNTAEGFGTILFAGPYKPQAPPGNQTFVQNYTVTVPHKFQTGPAVLSVAHFDLIGALFFPNLQVLNETVFIKK